MTGKKKPNILYLHSHDSGRYIQPYGHNVSTPNLQQLAEDGIIFRQAFCANPTCSPSRAALLTGQAPHSNGMVGLAHLGMTLNNYDEHIVNTLKNVGYNTVLSGTQHVAPEAEMIGYDRILQKEVKNKKNAAEVLADNFIKEDHEKPFFLSVGFDDTHRKFEEPAGDSPDTDPDFVKPPAPIPDTPETRNDMAGYNASCKTLDKKMGQVLAALEEAGLKEETLVICTTDHGLAFPYMKCNLTDHGTGVFLMMRGPEEFSNHQVIDSLVSQVDIFPTICDFINIEKPDWLQGHSLLPLVKGEKQKIRENVYTEVNYHVCYEPQRAVRTERYKYICRFMKQDTPFLPNCDDSPSKQLWMENGWQQKTIAKEQLYDLVFDPNETHNLADSSEHQEVLKEMRANLKEWMKETEDPLLEGPVPHPDNALLIQGDKISPEKDEKINADKIKPTLNHIPFADE